MGVVERSHSTVTRILNLKTIEQGNNWFKYVQLAIFINNTSFHSAVGCSPTVPFHGRERIKRLDLQFSNSLIERFSPKSEYVIALQVAVKTKVSETKYKLTERYGKNRAYHDSKAEAKPVALFTYFLLLNPKLMTQSVFASQSLPIWLPFYRFEKILTSFNYIVRKVGTKYTECVHQILLRPLTPQGCIDDLTVINSKTFKDPSMGHYCGKPTLFDESVPSLLGPHITVVATQIKTEGPPPVTVKIRLPIPPVPVPFGLAALLARFPPPALPAAPASLVAPDTAEVEAPELQVLELPYLLTQDFQFSDNSENFSTNDALIHARTLLQT